MRFAADREPERQFHVSNPPCDRLGRVVGGLFGAGLTAELENFQTLAVHRQRKRTSKDFNGKGHAQQMAAWTAFLRAESPHPVPFTEARRSMLLTFAAVEAIQQGRAVDVEP